jgi:hypothetical protein
MFNQSGAEVFLSREFLVEKDGGEPAGGLSRDKDYLCALEMFPASGIIVADAINPTVLSHSRNKRNRLQLRF